MKLVISPAKTLDFETPPKTKKTSQPEFLAETDELLGVMKTYTPKKLSKLMDISEKLADLNYERFQNFKHQPQKQAVLAFNGDVYDGLEAGTFSEKDFAFAQEHLRILSGLYGLLKPLDLMQAYRLEMGIALKTKKGKSLYSFWGDKITKALDDELIINLASNEYFSAIKPKSVIHVNFKETKNGKPVTIALFAKKARGMMAKYIIQNQITEPAKIKKFTAGGYKFNSKLSDDANYTFVR